MAAKKKTAEKKTKTKKTQETPALPWRLQKLIPQATK
jgi:hypothetical protein